MSASVKVPSLVAVMLGAMPQQHERGLGNWHAEWETLPEICLLTSGALAQLVKIVDGLELDTGRMRRNLDATQGLILAEAVSAALAKKMGREAAHVLVEEACRKAIAQGKTLQKVLGRDNKVGKLLSATALRKLLKPENYLGAAPAFVDRALAARGRKKK